MRFSVSNLHIDPESLEINECYQALLNIQGALTIYVDEEVFFKEPLFNVVELAGHINNWLNNPKQGFAFESMDAEEKDLLVFEPTKEGWLISSAWQELELSNPIQEEALFSACTSFVSGLKEDARMKLNIRLERFLDI